MSHGPKVFSYWAGNRICGARAPYEKKQINLPGLSGEMVADHRNSILARNIGLEMQLGAVEVLRLSDCYKSLN